MSTDTEALANLLEVAEGNKNLELLFSFPLPYDVVLKYELMREKTLKKVGLPHSSSKLWRLQNEANRKLKPKPKQEDPEVSTHEFIERLSASHEMTLKYARLIEETVQSIEKCSSKLSQILDNSSHSFPSFSKVQELEMIYYKDLNKFREMDVVEMKVLEFLSNRFFDREKDIFKTLNRVEERFVYYEKNVQNLQSQIESTVLKSRNEKEENEARVQELLATCHSYSEQIEKLKLQSSESWEHERKIIKNQLWASYEEKVKNMNEKMMETSLHMEAQVSEMKRDLGHKEKKIIEKYNENILQLETQIIELKRELTIKDKKLSENTIQTESQILELKREFSLKEKKLIEKFTEETSSFTSEIKELKRELSKKESELELNSSKQVSLKEELASQKLRNNEQREEINKLKAKTTDKELNQLKLMFNEHKEELALAKSKYGDLREELILYKSQCANYKEENTELKSLYSDSLRLRETFIKLQEVLHEIFLRYSNSHEEWQQEKWKDSHEDEMEEVVNEVEFLKFMISKMANDNNWLVDRLAELGQENQRLKDQSPKKNDMINELKATSNAFKGFENARSKLLHHFNDSKRDGSLNY